MTRKKKKAAKKQKIKYERKNSAKKGTKNRIAKLRKQLEKEKIRLKKLKKESEKNKIRYNPKRAKKAIKEKPVRFRTIAASYKKPKTLSLLKVKKTWQDKFSEISQSFKDEAFILKGKNKVKTFDEKLFKKRLKEAFNVDAKTLSRIQKGINLTDEEKNRITNLHRGRKKTKTISQFFAKGIPPRSIKIKRRIRDIKKGEKYHLKAGLKLIFLSKTSGEKMFIDGEEKEVWIIPNYTISNDSFDLPPQKAINNFINLIFKQYLNQFPSLYRFAFNYFNIDIIKVPTL